jgi:hypothetical protein
MLELNPLQKIQRIDEDVTETEFEGKVILLHIENGEYYNLNETGSDLWGYLAEPKTLDELVKLIEKKYLITAEDCQADILLWLESTINKKLLKILG